VSSANLDLQRKIDAYPTRLELQQYQTRVTELDEEIAWRYEETKLAFFRYNTQIEVVRCVENELEVFGTVKSQYSECLPASGSPASKVTKETQEARDTFLSNLKAFATQLTNARVQQASKLAEEQRALKDRASDCGALVARQQEIHGRLEEMKAAVEKHARLTAQLRELEEAAAEAKDDAELQTNA
jgi:chromosome segregation ATPase